LLNYIIPLLKFNSFQSFWPKKTKSIIAIIALIVALIIKEIQKRKYINENEFNDDVNKAFTDKEMKNLSLRIENELI